MFHITVIPRHYEEVGIKPTDVVIRFLCKKIRIATGINALAMT